MSATQESGQTPTIDLPRSPSVDPEGYFATLPEPSLRLVLIGFERDVVSQTHGLFANEEAARVCIGYANTHVARTQNPFGVVTPETLSPEQVSFFAHRLADWVSTQEIVRFTPQYVAPGRFKKSVDVNSLRPYGALAWEMMHNLSSSWGVHGKIARKKMYDSLIAHIGDHPIGDYVRKPGIRIEHFSRSYQEQLHSLRSAVKGDSVREPAPAPKSETRKQFTGSIPVFSNQFLASLYPETPNNIDGFLRLATSNGLDMVAIQGKLNKDLYALLSFVQWYRNQRFDEYDPYPETVLVRDFLEKFSAAANLIREMKDMGYKVNNLAELFVGMAKSAESIGLRKRAPVQEGKENASS